MVPETSPCRIVLAEDNPADVRLVQEALREHEVNCELRVLTDGEEVVSFITGLDLDSKHLCPDLLLLHMHLPKCDATEVLKHLLAGERCVRTRVVLTSSDAPSDHHSAEQNNAIHYFRKPSPLGQFMYHGQIVKDVLGGPASQRGKTSSHSSPEALLEILQPGPEALDPAARRRSNPPAIGNLEQRKRTA
jgi:CheY-like chemotaxis protein